MDFLNTKIEGRLNHIEKKVLVSKVCLYTVTNDSYFLVDEMPDFPEVLIASACSGHGFKHSAGLGEAISDTMVGKDPRIDLEAFKWKLPME